LHDMAFNDIIKDTQKVADEFLWNLCEW